MDSVRFLTARDLRAVSHPVRQQMLALLVRHGELSGREMRELIPNAPSNPYYHLGVLERAGLIRVVREEPRRGAQERYYTAVARTYSMDPGELVGPGVLTDNVRTGVLGVARNGAESALAALARTLETAAMPSRAEVPFINLCMLRLAPARAEEMRARLKDWLEEAAEAAREAASEEESDECEEYVFYQLFFHAAGQGDDGSS